MKQARSEPRLEPHDRLAGRRPRQVQPARGGGNAPRFRGCSFTS